MLRSSLAEPMGGTSHGRKRVAPTSEPRRTRDSKFSLSQTMTLSARQPARVLAHAPRRLHWLAVDTQPRCPLCCGWAGWRPSPMHEDDIRRGRCRIGLLEHGSWVGWAGWRDQTGWEKNRGPWKVWTGELPTRPGSGLIGRARYISSILSAPPEKRIPQGSHVLV